jgi:hypothetical protein
MEAPAVETADPGAEAVPDSESASEAEPESDPEDAVPDPAPEEAEAVRVAWPLGVAIGVVIFVSLALRRMLEKMGLTVLSDLVSDLDSVSVAASVSVAVPLAFVWVAGAEVMVADTLTSSSSFSASPVFSAAAPPRVLGSIKMGEYVSVPSYAGHPGTVVLGGARPPPQSRRSQISPESGTYQILVAYMPSALLTTVS